MVNQKRHISLLGWLILWVLWLPLVHIHPEIDHAHGMPGHVHGGTFHTLLSSTPICDYEDHRHHHSSFISGEAFGASEPTPHVPHGLEHFAYGFPVLGSSLNPVPEGNFTSSSIDGFAACAIQPATITAGSPVEPSPPIIHLPSLVQVVSTRAPPFFSF